MSLIRIIFSIIGMIVVFSIIAEYIVMPAYTRQNQNRIMIDIKNRNLDDVIKIFKKFLDVISQYNDFIIFN